MNQSVSPHRMLLFLGVVGSAIFIATTLVLGFLSSGYSPASQTVSEIGRVGAEFALSYKVLVLFAGGAIVLFSSAVGQLAGKGGSSWGPALSIAAYGVCTCGLALFPTPHPLHNVFGLLLLLGYIAPLLVWLV